MTGRLLGRQRVLVAGAALVTLVAGGGSAAYAVTLNQPTDVVCGPFENGGLDRNVVYWTDTSDGETGFRVERSVDGGAFTTLATAPANTGSHTDSGLTAGRVYRYRVLAVDGTTTGPVSEQCRQFAFFDTPEGNFRTYFRPYAVADCPPRFGAPSCVPATTTAGGANEYGSRIGGLLEGSLTGLRAVGFEDFATYGGGKRFPVDLIWCDGGGCAGTNAVGSPTRKGYIGLAPQFMGPYDPVTGAGDPSSVLITLHEAFHQAQYAYGGAWGDPAGNWVYEGQARSIQDKVCVGTAASCVSLDAVPGGLANYLGDVRNYLADPGRDVTRLSYTAALFWTYLLEQYGRTTAEPGRGMDLMHEFWVQGRANFFDTGIGTIDRTLAALGHTDRFADVFRNFAVANYAKDLTGPSVPARYKYADEQQPPGKYPAVALRADTPLAVGGRVGPTADTVPSWGVRYYEFEPAAATPLVDVRVTQDAPAHPAFYSLLLIKDGDVVEEIRSNGPDFAQAVPNDGYDKVVLVVGGLANALSYRYTVDTSGSLLRIVDPLTSRKAQAGTATAPRKVLVKAALRSATGDPMAGLGASAFAVTIGGKAATVVSSAFLQGQYWLLVQAPTQPADGTYDLGVAAAGLSAAQPQAVVYGAPPNTDSEVVVDRSGSMLDHDKLPSAKAGARLYVDTWEASDEAGLVSFNADATVDKALDPLTPAHRADVKAAIDALAGGGSTSIGDGLYAALDQLDTRGDQGDNWAVVVLSDGLENTERRIADFLATYGARRTAGTKNPKVHTIALGPDADRVNMQKLAAETGGTYHAAAVDTTAPGSGISSMSAASGEPRDSGNALAAVYRQISQEAAGEQQVFSTAGPLPASETFAVDGGTERLSVALHANGSDFTPALLDPAGVAHAPTRSDTGHAYWRIPSPAAGEWTLDVTCGPSCPTEFVADAAVVSSLTMQAQPGLAPEDRLVGRAMPILVSLSDTGPITGATVDAEVTAPDGSRRRLPLRDDGRSGDGAAGDGFYGAVYPAAFQPGDYVAVVSADGTSAAYGEFTRRERVSFGLTHGADADGDGLPDWWEDRYGTDRAVADAVADPDADGLANDGEFGRSTHPRDADTDDGGERDDTDPAPLDPADDRLSVPDVEAYAGAGEVLVRYSTAPAYATVRVERAPAAAGPWTTLATVPATGLHTDSAVTDGVEHCYRVTALGAGAVSAPSDASCATPRLDPVAPTGQVRIDGGADVTFDHDVELELFGVDSHEPELQYPGAPSHGERTRPSGVADVMISNDPAFAGAAWEPYVPTRQWTVAPEGELATVYVKYRDAAGNVSHAVHASIRVLDLAECDVVGTEGNDHLVGTDAAEVICGLGGNDHVDGRGGMDAILGGDGNDVLAGGLAGDLLVGGAGNDVLRGEDGNDRIAGGDGNDTIVGGPGADDLDGEAGRDNVHGDGDDTVEPDPQDNVVRCRGRAGC